MEGVRGGEMVVGWVEGRGRGDEGWGGVAWYIN